MPTEVVQVTGEPQAMQPHQPPADALATADMLVAAAAGDDATANQPTGTADACSLSAAHHQRPPHVSQHIRIRKVAQSARLIAASCQDSL